MCPDAIHLTLQGENVVECAEFLFTTLLTFLLFGTQVILKGSTLSSHFTSIHVFNDLFWTLVCKKMFYVALDIECLLLFCVQLQCNHMELCHMIHIKAQCDARFQMLEMPVQKIWLNNGRHKSIEHQGKKKKREKLGLALPKKKEKKLPHYGTFHVWMHITSMYMCMVVSEGGTNTWLGSRALCDITQD